MSVFNSSLSQQFKYNYLFGVDFRVYSSNGHFSVIKGALCKITQLAKKFLKITDNLSEKSFSQI